MNVRVAGTYLRPEIVKSMKPAVKGVEGSEKGANHGNSRDGRPRNSFDYRGIKRKGL